MKMWRNRTARMRAPRGFSLLELTLVLAIMGILMAVVAYNVMGQGAKAKAKATKASMSVIDAALKQYNLEYSAFPPGLQTLIGAKILDPSKPLKDAWDVDIYYDPRGTDKDHPYILKSAGEDKQLGTDDDIDVWNMGH